jgi:hypothetical protein
VLLLNQWIDIVLFSAELMKITAKRASASPAREKMRCSGAELLVDTANEIYVSVQLKQLREAVQSVSVLAGYHQPVIFAFEKH